MALHQTKAGSIKLEKAVVAGAGIMGHGIAQLLAMNGIRVFLVDRNEKLLSRARGWMQDNLNYMVELELLPEAGISETLSKVVFTTELNENLKGAGYVLEAITEDFDLKRGLWKVLGRHADPKAILASNTSSYDIDELACDVPNPERVVGTHWFHPPQITPCVEVIPSRKAAKEHIDFVMDFLAALGKMPTRCKSAPGFVANRLQMALAAEAIALVEEGLATPSEVDRIVKTSFGFRLGAYGPFEIMDQAGADTYLSIYQYLYARLAKEHFKPSPLLVKQVEDGRLGLKSSKGFYDYGEGAADAMRRDRDRKFYARLSLLRKEDI